jgi:hypothetical protein
MSHILINSYVEHNLLTELTAYLSDPTNTIPEEDIYDAIELTQTHQNIAIKRCLIEYLIRTDCSVNLATDEGIIDPTHEKLIQDLFRYALKQKKIDTASELLTQSKDRQALLNQKNENGVPFVNELFKSNDILGVKFLIEHKASINIPGPQNETLVTLVGNATIANQTQLPLLNDIAKNNGDFSNFIIQNPRFLFTAAEHAKEFPDLFVAVLKSSPNLLIQHYNNLTVFEIIKNSDDPETLEHLLKHVETLVIHREEVMRAQNPRYLPISQLENTSYVLDHCISLSLLSPKTNDSYLYSQGILRFLALYYPDQQFKAPDPITFTRLQETSINELNLRKLTINEIQLLFKIPLYVHHIMVNAFHLQNLVQQADMKYLNSHRKPAIEREEQQEKQRLQDIKRQAEQQEKIIRQQEESRRNNIEQAHSQINNGIAEYPEQISAVLEKLTTIINTRDQKKIIKKGADWIFSSVTFITALAYFIRAAVQENDPNDQYSNLDSGAIALAVHWALRFTMGTYDLDYESLQYKHLPEDLRQEVSSLIAKLKHSNLTKIEINEYLQVNALIQNLWEAGNNCKTRLEGIQNLIPLELVIIPQAFTPPELINYRWEPEYDPRRTNEERFFTFLCATGVEGVISLIGCYKYNDIKNIIDSSEYDTTEYHPVDRNDLRTPHTICFKVGGFVAIQLGIFPAYWLGKGFYNLGQSVGISTKECIIHNYNRLLTHQYNRHNGSDIEMQNLNTSLALNPNLTMHN